jgi:hypothetical protein
VGSLFDNTDMCSPFFFSSEENDNEENCIATFPRLDGTLLLMDAFPRGSYKITTKKHHSMQPHHSNNNNQYEDKEEQKYFILFGMKDSSFFSLYVHASTCKHINNILGDNNSSSRNEPEALLQKNFFTDQKIFSSCP